MINYEINSIMTMSTPCPRGQRDAGGVAAAADQARGAARRGEWEYNLKIKSKIKDLRKRKLKTES